MPVLEYESGVEVASLPSADQKVFRPKVLALAAGEDAVIDCRGNVKLTVITDGGVKSTGTLTLTANPANTETVVIDGKTYTFQTTLTDSDGNVLIGATASDSLDNLIAAINLGAGAGTLYAASTTLHSTVSAAAGAGDTMDVTAKVGGVSGDSITTTETLANGSWGGGTLSGGVDGVATVSRVDSSAATAHTTGTENSFTVARLTKTATDVDWPFFRVSMANGNCRVGLI